MFMPEWDHVTTFVVGGKSRSTFTVRLTQIRTAARCNASASTMPLAQRTNWLPRIAQQFMEKRTPLGTRRLIDQWCTFIINIRCANNWQYQNHQHRFHCSKWFSPQSRGFSSSGKNDWQSASAAVLKNVSISSTPALTAHLV